MAYQTGDKVEYKPIGGSADNVAHSTGQVVNVVNEEGGTRYVIKNDNTGKETTYQEMNIVKKI
ncbi:hypothetical protein BV25DRAFT_1913928 [Artomyces pyxidatus]|uniref:Uncharacterized protein n=1 Tax=Artomyces pyxidatus TaxID=48021 RepID=A0ACB8T874_9AGAM|nr:hypothetical protein BV25DRAFT_1913928 [Artomyces pyxidatus]